MGANLNRHLVGHALKRNLLDVFCKDPTNVLCKINERERRREKRDNCCVVRPANGCSVCRLLVEIKLKLLFPSLTEENKEKREQIY